MKITWTFETLTMEEKTLLLLRQSEAVCNSVCVCVCFTWSVFPSLSLTAGLVKGSSLKRKNKTYQHSMNATCFSYTVITSLVTNILKAFDPDYQEFGLKANG